MLPALIFLGVLAARTAGRRARPARRARAERRGLALLAAGRGRRSP